ncbi:MAG: hypothetical protein ACQESA_02735 [Patescibacteria group bacterium]
MEIVFAAIAPHPPILLPTVGSEEDRKLVSGTVLALGSLSENFKEKDPERIFISSPHPDWGFNVPLFFLAQGFNGEVETLVTGLEEPVEYFKKGKEVYNLDIRPNKEKVALIASGDLSHKLKSKEPYEYHPDGEKFDRELIDSLKKKDLENILDLSRKYPEAGECGLRSFCFLLGLLEARKETEAKGFDFEIMSYEAPFGVGYLVVDVKL